MIPIRASAFSAISLIASGPFSLASKLLSGFWGWLATALLDDKPVDDFMALA